MKWRTEKTPEALLFFLTCLAILCLILAERSVVLERQPFYVQKIGAAKTTLLAMIALKNEAMVKDLIIDSVNDPNETGLIGSEFTLVTTDRGNLTSKLTATNPNFGAIIVEMLRKAKLKKGDSVGVAMTGSFPVLNIAVLAALESLELEPTVITSVGASSWGANDPEMTWLDMERFLHEKGLIRTRSLAASIGGGKDIGRGLSPKGRELIRESIQRNGIQLIHKPLLEESIKERIRIYDRSSGKKKVKAYINVGGGVASLGSPINGTLFPAGLSLNAGFQNFPTKGVINLMSERGIPVIHLLKISELARTFNLPIAPVPLPELAHGSVYFKERYERVRLVLITLFLSGIVIFVVRFNLSHYLAQIKRIRSGGVTTGSSMLPPLRRKSDKSDSGPLPRSKE